MTADSPKAPQVAHAACDPPPVLNPKTRDSLTFGPWRRRRRMQRLLAELDRLDRGGRRPRSAARLPGDRRRRFAAGLLAVVLTLVLGGVFAHKQWGVTLAGDGFHVATPLGTPPEVSGGVGSFTYLQTQPGSDQPVAYDPCRPVEYLVNDTLAPRGADRLLRSAIEEISAATGLVFRPVGKTDEEPRPRPDYLLPRRDPVLIAWTTPQVVPGLEGDVAGLGGSTARKEDYTGQLTYVTGMVALDAPDLTRVMAREQGPQAVRAIIMHELGHLVGLDHVDDPRELMYPDNVGQLDLGPGDREGLANLGKGRCLH